MKTILILAFALILFSCSPQTEIPTPTEPATTIKTGEKYMGYYVFKTTADGHIFVLRNDFQSNLWDTVSAKIKKLNGELNDNWMLPSCTDIKNIFILQKDSGKNLGVTQGAFWCSGPAGTNDAPIYDNTKPTNPCVQTGKKNRLNFFLIKEFTPKKQ